MAFINPISFLYDFLKAQPGWILNMGLSHFLFWMYGYPDLKEYGYSNELADDGSIPSGPLGSGGPIFTLAICAVMSLVTVVKLITHKYEKAPNEICDGKTS